MERLGSEWVTLDKVGEQQREEAKAAALETLKKARSVIVKVGSQSGTAAHGDARSPNIMVRHAEEGWQVRFVDLDWAGLSGIATYPFALNPHIGWHRGAQQGAPLEQEHDVYLLSNT
jgi:aminoglycoside phosphotransferase